MAEKIEWTKAQSQVLECDGNQLVSASAGSGKTAVMLEKALGLLKKGGSIDKFLIMTFTNAAAAEMKEKLIRKLYAEIRSTGDTHLKKQLELINFSSICTIDSFCFGLYKKYFAEMGLDPSFELLDEKESRLLFNECIESLAAEILQGDDKKQILAFLERFIRNRDIGPLKAAVKRISEYLDYCVDEREFIDYSLKLIAGDIESHPAAVFYMRYHRERLKRLLEEAQALWTLAQSMPSVYSVYKDIINNIMEYLECCMSAKSVKEFAEALDLPLATQRIPSKKADQAEAEFASLVSELRTQAKKYTDKLREDFDDYYNNGGQLLNCSFSDIKTLLDITLRVRKKYAESKLEQNKFDFADLSKTALRILENPRLRKIISESYDYVFVDEYQDTNYIQEKIINLICRDNNLFMVGDPKQAIYQFRFARPEIFLNRQKEYGDGAKGKNQKLNENFRSDKRILDFVNLVFNQIMTAEFGGVDYKGNAELECKPELVYPIVSQVPAVEIALYKKEKQEEEALPSVYSVMGDKGESERDTGFEAQYIAQKIQSMAGKEYIYDSSIKTKRLAQYKDIAILMYSRNGKDIMQEFKKRGIPYTAPGFEKERIYEINLLADYLRVIDNAANDIPLAAVMQSPLFDFSDRQMAEIRKSDTKAPFWEAVINYKGDQTIKNKIHLLKEKIEKHRTMSSYCGVYDILSAIMREGFDAYLLSKGEETISKVNSFINGVKGKDYAANIPSFLQFFDEVFDDSVSVPSHADAVKFMTIHNSKGLEFPIVFVANAHRGFTHSHDNDNDLFLDNEFGMAVKYFYEKDKLKLDTLITKGFKLKKRFIEKAELMRLMYVAFTRAKNHLFIVGEDKDSKSSYADNQENFAQWINLAKKKNKRIADYFYKGPLENEEAKEEEKIVIAENKYLDLSLLKKPYPHMESSRLPLKFSVTELSKTEDYSEEEYEPKTVYLTQEERVAEGVIYHKLIEFLDFSLTSKADIERQIKKFIKEGKLKEEETKSLDLNIMVTTLNSEILEKARQSGNYVKEKKFMLYLPYNLIDKASRVADKVLVQGAIDLLILGKENIIADFKFTRSGEENIKKRYKAQLDLYKLAVESLLGIKVHRQIIYVINKNREIELSKI